METPGIKKNVEGNLGDTGYSSNFDTYRKVLW